VRADWKTRSRPVATDRLQVLGAIFLEFSGFDNGCFGFVCESGSCSGRRRLSACDLPSETRAQVPALRLEERLSVAAGLRCPAAGCRKCVAGGIRPIHPMEKRPVNSNRWRGRSSSRRWFAGCGNNRRSCSIPQFAGPCMDHRRECRSVPRAQWGSGLRSVQGAGWALGFASTVESPGCRGRCSPGGRLPHARVRRRR
jgi:hypothetical protein